MSGLVCMSCGRIHPDTAKKCHPCNNTELIDRHCTSDYRVAEYFAILRRCELWPSLNPFTTCALSDITFRIKCAQTDHKHQCGARADCPLRRELDGLVDRVQRTLKDIKRIPLQEAPDNVRSRQNREEDYVTSIMTL
jgi:hypothetical protein